MVSYSTNDCNEFLWLFCFFLLVLRKKRTETGYTCEYVSWTAYCRRLYAREKPNGSRKVTFTSNMLSQRQQLSRLKRHRFWNRFDTLRQGSVLVRLPEKPMDVHVLESMFHTSALASSPTRPTFHQEKYLEKRLLQTLNHLLPEHGMTNVLPHDWKYSDTETFECNENVPNEKDILSGRLHDAFISVQNNFTVSQANKFYKIFFQERNNFKPFS